MKCFLLLSLLVITACTNNSELKDDDEKSAQALVGVWRGMGDYQDQEDKGWSENWMISRHMDGTFEVQYLLVNDNKKEYELSTDKGRWSYENGHYLEVNSYEEKSVYKVYSLKKDWFEYNFIQRGDGVTIQETKTVEDYQLREPPEGYTKFNNQQSGISSEAKEVVSKTENQSPEIQSNENQPKIEK